VYPDKLMLQAAAIALIALILTPGLSFYYDITPKLVVLLLASGVTLVPVRGSKLMGLVILTLASLALSTALSPNPALSFYGAHWRRYGALTQAAVLMFAWALSTQTHRIGLILRAVSSAGALTAAYGIAQYFGWDPILPAAAYHVGEGVFTIVRPPSTLGYASYFATWLLFVVFLSLALPGRLAKACAALALIALVFTGTRAAFLGLATGAAVWGGMRLRSWRAPTRRVLWRATSFVGAGLLGVFVFSFTPSGQPLRSRARWFVEDPWGGARPLLWRDSLRMGLARPLAGQGPETFTAAFPHFESAALARAYPDFAHESPHNIFLDALVAQGITGFLLLAAWCTLGFAAAWKVRGQHPDLAACLAAALAAGIVSQQFTVFTIPTAVIFSPPSRSPRVWLPAPPNRSDASRSRFRYCTSPHDWPLRTTRLPSPSAISPPAISPPPPRIMRPPAALATSGIRAPSSPPPGKRPRSPFDSWRSNWPPPPANAPRVPRKTPLTPGTASPQSVPARTTPPAPSAASAPPSPPTRPGSNPTGPWLKSYASNRGLTRR